MPKDNVRGVRIGGFLPGNQYVPYVLTGLLFVFFAYKQTMLQAEIEALHRQMGQLRITGAASQLTVSAKTSGDDWGAYVVEENLPMSIRLARKKHLDTGKEEKWTDMVSPLPQPPPAVTRVKQKTSYGGSTEADHIGGFLTNDTQSYEPRIWEFMVHVLGVKSVLDIGCGRGISTKWFMDNGCRVHCAEATNEGIETTVLPSRDLITQHDFTQGPWWPQETYDAVWSVEFLEHVHEDYMDNWFATMRSAHYVFTSHSRWGGHHHVAIHHDWWWIEKFESRGFEYLPEMTDIVRRMSFSGNYMSNSALVFRNSRNVRIKPMYGPGTGGQHCEETLKVLWNTRLLKQACSRANWEKGANPLIPWVKKCKDLCTKLDYNNPKPTRI